MSTQAEIHNRITDPILTALSDPSKLSPWRRPWTALDANTGQPCNALTGTPYRGINTVALSMSAQQRGYQSRHWLTFRQAKEMGRASAAGRKALTSSSSSRSGQATQSTRARSSGTRSV